MSEEKNTTNAGNQNSTTPARGGRGGAGGARDGRGAGVGGQRRGGARSDGRRGGRDEGERDEFDQRLIDLARVTRVMAGGKRMRFRACVAIGDKKGQIGLGLAKGADVTLAINKAVAQAKKNIITVPSIHGTITHRVEQKFGAARILLNPAPEGTGIICGGVVRLMIEVSGLNNVTGKILGTNNKVNNAKCVMAALAALRPARPLKK